MFIIEQEIIRVGGFSQRIFNCTAVSSRSCRVDLFTNIFHLNTYQISYAHVTDLVNRAIGVYEQTSRQASIRTYNPFWWFARGLIWFSRLPIWFLGEIGFDSQKIEQSIWGKIIKGMFTVVGSILGGILPLLSILEKLSLLEPLKRHFGIIHTP